MESFTGHISFSGYISGQPMLFCLIERFNAFSIELPGRLCYGTPWHWNQDPALHLFNQRNSLVNCLSPSFHTPTHLSSRFSLFEICKLPEVMYSVQISDLDEPCTNPFHDFSPGFEASSPVCLPLKQISWVQSVGPQFEQATELAGWCCGPEGEFLHQRCVL